MKKLILTAALLVSFVGSYANDIKIESNIVDSVENKIKIEKKELPQENSPQSLTLLECYLLSCGQVCFDNSVESSPGCDIECIFDALEYLFCE